MHLGEIQQLGTPSELRSRLHAKRLELRTANLGEAERVLAPLTGEQGAIIDVQRFGDRLDLLAHDPAQAQRVLAERLDAAGIAIENLRIDNPTLENIFVATLRSLGHEMHETVFPGRHDHCDLRGQVAIGARDLTMQFGSFTAVRNLNVEVKYGEIYGLLGANGAGKTTTIKMLCGLLDPTRGEIQLARGRGSALARSQGVRQRLGYISQKFSLYDDLTIQENLEFFAGVYGVPESEREEKRQWVLSFSGLEGKQDQITGSLPGGWKQRVAFGAAIMHEPSVLFLDEPTSGVDPLARRAFWTMINRLADAGAAVLVTTHYLEEAEQCNRLGLMVAGELVAAGTPSGIKSQQPGHLLELHVDRAKLAIDRLKHVMERWRVSLFGDRLHVIMDEDAEQAQRVLSDRLSAEGVRVLSVREARFSLEDVFISVVEQARREGKVAAEN